MGKNGLTVAAPAADNSSKENSGQVEIVVKGHDGTKDAVAAFDVKSFHVMTFEDVPQTYLAGPTAYGENLYDGSYAGYLDQVSGLFLNTTTGGYGFASGGIAVSQWNDMTTAGYTNQCSVYYGTNGANDGGVDNSKTFAVVHAPTFGESGGYMYFKADGTERALSHAWFMNNTYALLSMEQGDGFGKKFSYADKDWCKLTIVGVDASGETTGEVEVYLADFRTADAPGILKDWKRVDLKPLGKVSRVNFSISSSDGEGMYMNTPAYFCMDNIAVEL